MRLRETSVQWSVYTPWTSDSFALGAYAGTLIGREGQCLKIKPSASNEHINWVRFSMVQWHR